MRIPIFGDWQDIGLTELFYAYRKAKADCFFERSLYLAGSFAEYEQSLTENLTSLLQRLHDGEIDEVLAENLGEPRVVGKKLGAELAVKDEPHSYFSDPERAFKRLKALNQISPEFRLVGDFPVIAHVISALWINEVGQKFDAALPSSAYGSRLRRYRRQDAPTTELGNYQLYGIGSFEPYYEPYKTWRRLGLDAIGLELKKDKSVIALSLDFTNYYHNVDPRFISNPSFHAEIGVDLDEWELTFTESIGHFLFEWGKKSIAKMEALGAATLGVSHGGLPIGLSAVRVISNVLLCQLDRTISVSLSPVYYGRYVDDIFLVLRDFGEIETASGVWKFISKHCNFFEAPRDDQPMRFNSPVSWGETNLVLQQSKQKLFFLSGKAGSDLLSSIDAELKSVSSERRLMPSVDGLADMASAHVLTAAGSASEEADTLRRADGLSVKRLGWAVQLRSVETLARNLRPEDWEKERHEFYEFATLHIIRPDKILEHFDYLHRLISIAVALREWSDARRLVDAAMAAITDLEAIRANEGRINGVQFPVSGEVWDELRESLKAMCADAIVRSIPWRAGSQEPYALTKAGQRLCSFVGLGSQESVLATALTVREVDWAKTPYKDHIRRDAGRQRPKLFDEAPLQESYEFEQGLRDFLDDSSKEEHDVRAPRVRPDIRMEDPDTVSLLPYLFPTRPYSTREIALFLPEKCVVGGEEEAPLVWAQYVRAVRGAWVKLPGDGSGAGGPGSPAADNGDPDGPPYAVIGRTDPQRDILIGISSLETTDDSWHTTASGKAANSRDRWKRIRRIVNLAVTAHPRPKYLLLPELSLPDRWIPTVSGMLNDAGINLICGLDYQTTHSGTVHSSAVLVLEDDRLGFRSWIEFRQPKTQPAPAEEKELLQLYGKSWTVFPKVDHKHVYAHFGFCFGVLICSELQNIAYRKSFQGHVDALMILSWNRDVETFAPLVESASLDVHAFVGLVNNRRFGDSRMRAPGKLLYQRDLCRLRGGLNEHLVVVKLDIAGLRMFQSRAKRWPDDHDAYKPTPENFRISDRRRTRPA